MRTIRRSHTPAFKKQVVIELMRGEKTKGEICSQFAVHPSLAEKWRIRVIDGMDKLFTEGISDQSKQDHQLIEELYKQIGQLKVEADWLKKKMGLIR